MGHTSQITNICWFSSSLFVLSSSTDGIVYQWSIAQTVPITTFKHETEVICISIHPQTEDIFFSGCKDNHLRMWTCHNSAITCDLAIEGEITTGIFSPNGLIVIGTSQGICLVLSYNVFSRSLEIINRIDCRNKRGPKSSGRKILF